MKCAQSVASTLVAQLASACGSVDEPSRPVVGDEEKGVSVMTLSLPVGETVPSSVFEERVRRAVLTARTGRSRWVDQGDVEANFTIAETGTNLQVVGLGDTTEARPFRLVDGVAYARWRVRDRPWKSNEAPLGLSSIGTPVGLMDALPEGHAVVVKQTNGLTTFRLPVSFYAVHRAIRGDISVVPGTEGDGVLDSFWVIGEQDLVQEVTVPHQGEITFLDWGSAPEVGAPPAPDVEDELEYFLRNGPAVDAAR